MIADATGAVLLLGRHCGEPAPAAPSDTSCHCPLLWHYVAHDVALVLAAAHVPVSPALNSTPMTPAENKQYLNSVLRVCNCPHVAVSLLHFHPIINPNENAVLQYIDNQ